MRLEDEMPMTPSASDPVRLPPELQRALDEYFAPPADDQLARAQARLRQSLAEPGTTIQYELVPETPVGPLWLASTERGLMAVKFGGTESEFLAELPRSSRPRPVRSREGVARAAEQVREYFRGERTAFDLPIDWTWMSDFQRRVLTAALSVHRGQVTTYGEIARQIGRPGASRAVGQALGHNPVPIVLPCHRVLASNGSLGGYSGGLAIKIALLKMEGVLSA